VFIIGRFPAGLGNYCVVPRSNMLRERQFGVKR